MYYDKVLRLSIMLLVFNAYYNSKLKKRLAVADPEFPLGWGAGPQRGRQLNIFLNIVKKKTSKI